ncbi:MAG: 30S ribosomal protein S6 [Clostridium sp.]|nr:MAG: 30S ribosomal protein S6 [Clostridium sp.]
MRPKGGVVMNKYEIMFIVKTDIDEKTQKEVVKTFGKKVLTDMKAKVVNSKDMGQRKISLSY